MVDCPSKKRTQINKLRTLLLYFNVVSEVFKLQQIGRKII